MSTPATVNTGRIRRDINPGPNSVFPECPGANDDIAVFELRDGNFPLRDSDGNTITAKRRLIAQLTIKDGRVWYERPPE